MSLPASPTEDMKQQILTEVEKTDEGFTILEIPSAIDVLKDTTLDNEVIEELLAEAASDITEQVPDISADEKYVPTEGATTEMAPDAYYDIMVSEPLVLESGAVVMDAQPSTEKFKTVIDDNKVHVPVSSREDEESLNLASIDDKPEPEDLPRTALSGGADLELSYTIEELSDTTMIAFPEKLSEAEKEYMQIQATPTKDLLEEVILMETSNRDQQNKEFRMDKEVDYLTESPAEVVPSGKAEIEIVVTKAEMKTEDIDVLEVEELEQENKEITETEQLAAKVDTVAETGETVGVEKTRAIDIDAEVAHIAEKLEAETAVPDMESQTEPRAKTVCVQLDLEHPETIQPESKETEVEKKTFVAEAVPEFMKADEKKPEKMAVLEPEMEIETEEAEVAKIQKAAEVGVLAKSEETVMVKETKAVDIEAET